MKKSVEIERTKLDKIVDNKMLGVGITNNLESPTK